MLTNIVFIHSFFLVVALTNCADIMATQSIYITPEDRDQFTLFFTFEFVLCFHLASTASRYPSRMGCCWIAPFDHCILCRLLAFE